MLSIKHGVDLVGITVPMLMATMVVNSVYSHYEAECTITTGRNGVHMRGSLHYAGNALDYRTKNIAEDSVKTAIYKDIKERLGMQYDVVLHPYVNEGNPGHLHIEFQPKEKL